MILVSNIDKFIIYNNSNTDALEIKLYENILGSYLELYVSYLHIFRNVYLVSHTAIFAHIKWGLETFYLLSSLKIPMMFKQYVRLHWAAHVSNCAPPERQSQNELRQQVHAII